ncbi:MAG: RNA-binding protein [Dehalococcoidia bacterium]|nr:RNA-binding protein [Dehalococcoidia bacterium]MCA9830910.1 RNA-binding protein [Dehalococcoidia bacterium]MCB9485109.1 RNA-binding protein [Thermoflexaceae bacterium]
MRIFVGQLSYSTTEQSLGTIFAPYNPESVRIITDRDTGQSRGFGFVEIADTETANKAIRELNGQMLDGRGLQINEARAREDRPAPRGGGGGGGGGGRRW